MNGVRQWKTLSYLAALLSCGAFTLNHGSAQVMTCGDMSVTGTGCALGPQLAGFEDAVKGEPYIAQATTEIEQTIADGTHITQTITSSSARDSAGRTFQRMTLGGSDASGQNNKSTITNIFDPTTKTHIDYTSDAKVAHEFTFHAADASLPDAPGASARPQVGAGFAMRASGATVGGGGPVLSLFAATGTLQPNSKKDALGTKNVAGVEATGSRTTATIPAGTMGNDRDLVTTQEIWYSPELKLVLLSIQSDPRFGVTKYSVTDLERSEPDASLFQIPAGYSVDHRQPFVVRDSGNN